MTHFWIAYIIELIPYYLYYINVLSLISRFMTHFWIAYIIELIPYYLYYTVYYDTCTLAYKLWEKLISYNFMVYMMIQYKKKIDFKYLKI